MSARESRDVLWVVLLRSRKENDMTVTPPEPGDDPFTPPPTEPDDPGDPDIPEVPVEPGIPGSDPVTTADGPILVGLG